MASFTRKLRKAQWHRTVTAGSVQERIAELRRLMVEAPHLAPIATHYLDALSQDPEFMKAGSRRLNERLVSIARIALKSYFADTAALDQVLYHLAAEHLWHGAVLFRNGTLALVVYFDDVNCGICVALGPPEHTVHYFRFSIPEEMAGPIDPDTVRLVFHQRKPPGALN